MILGGERLFGEQVLFALLGLISRHHICVGEHDSIRVNIFPGRHLIINSFVVKPVKF